MARNYLARLNADGSLDTSYNPNPNSFVGAIVIQSNGQILIGGPFSQLNPNPTSTSTATSVSCLARLNTDGTVDTNFEPNPAGQVMAIVLQSSSNAIIIGGTFTSITPTQNLSIGVQGTYSQINYVARISSTNGTLDTSFNPNPNGPVTTMALQSDGKLVLGGNFTTLQPNPVATTSASGTVVTPSPTTRNYLARVNADATLDQSFDPEPNGPVLSVAVNSTSGQILAGGLFTTIAGGAGDYVARLSSAGALDSSFSPSLNGQVSEVVYLTTNQFYVCGMFTSVTAPGASVPFAIEHLARFNTGGTLDTTFLPHVSSSGQVGAIAVQSDGRVVFGGTFSELAGTPGTNLARLNTDSSPDQGFDVSTNGPVNTVVLPLSGLPVSTQETGLAWLTSTGSLYSGFAHDSGAKLSGTIMTIAVQSNGAVLVGGSFTNAANSAGGAIVRFSSQGVLDTSFYLDPGWSSSTTATATNAQVYAIAVQSDGKILVGGSFTEIGGVAINYIARFNADGTQDTAFNPNPNAMVNVIVIQPDGRILIGGSFNTIQPGAGTNTSYNRYYMARLNTDGTLDTSFNPNGTGGVSAIVLQADGKIVVGGSFTSFQPNGVGSNITRNYIARLNSDGTLDSGYDPEANGAVSALALQSDGRVVAGGSFTTFEPNGATATTTRSYIARLNTDGTIDAVYDPEANGAVSALAVQSDGRMIIAGSFSTFEPNGASVTTAHNYLARLNTDGTLDTTFDANPNALVDVVVMRPDGTMLVGGSFTTVQPNNAIILGGSFSTVNGAAVSNLAMLYVDGTLDTASLPNPNATVYAMAVQPDGRTLVAGAFTSIGGAAVSGLARLKSDTTLDSAFNPNVSGTVYSVALQADGRIVLGGSFTSVRGVACGNVARINSDGSLDSSFSAATNGAVRAIAIQPNGQIVVSGSFSTADAVAHGNIARFNSDGSIDAGFSASANGAVNALALQTDGALALGGSFTAVDGAAAGYLARVNSDGTLDGTFTSYTNGAVSALALQADGKLFVAGGFTQLDGVTRFGYGRLTPTAAAAQSLSVSSDLSTVTWIRSGSGPEVSQAMFQYSTDGVTWSNLGQGSRVGATSSWQITGLSLPLGSSFYVLVLGVSPASQYGSSGLVGLYTRFYVVQTSSLSSASSSSATTGAPYFYAVAATNSPVTYWATGLPAGLTLNPVTGVISGTPTQSGTSIVTLRLSNAGGSTTTTLQITVSAASSGTAVPPAARLMNLSSRGPVTAANPLIGGFVVTGSASKTLLLRAIGPGLKTFGVTGTLAEPVLNLYDSSGRLIRTNQGWGGNSSLLQIFALTGAFPLSQGGADSAIATTLAPGLYTLVVTSGDGTSGDAMAEIYDADTSPFLLTQRLVNLSGRSGVTAANLQIGGFVIGGILPSRSSCARPGPPLPITEFPARSASRS